MKFYITTLAKTTLVLILVLISAQTWAQVTSLSPYSRFGIGTLLDQGTANQISMGGVSSAFADYATINFQNPASYSMMLKSGLHAGGKGQFLQLNTQDQSEWLNISSINNIALNFKRQGGKFGMVVGLAPFSTTGYSITDVRQNDDLGEINYTYDGEGGVNKAYLGASRFVLLERDKGLLDKTMAPDSTKSVTIVSFGANLNYFFGQLEQTRRVIFDDASFLHTKISNSITVRDINFDIGALALINLSNSYKGKEKNKKTDLLVGFTYSLGNDLNTNFSELTESITYANDFEVIVDTVALYESSNASITLPQRITAGLGIVRNLGNNRTIEFQLDFKTQDWSKFSGEFAEITQTTVLAKAQSYHFGIRYTPSNVVKASKFFKSIDYRIGVRYGDTYLRINDQQITESAISAGISIPLKRSSSSSRIIFGTEFGQKGTTESDLIQENFINVHIGLSLTPHLFNNWFVKRQYD